MNNDPAVKQFVEDSIDAAFHQCLVHAVADEEAKYHVVQVVAGLLFKQVAIYTRDVRLAEEAEARFLIKLQIAGTAEAGTV